MPFRSTGVKPQTRTLHFWEGAEVQDRMIKAVQKADAQVSKASNCVGMQF